MSGNLSEMTPDDDVLVKLDRAHKGFEGAVAAYQADMEKAHRQVVAKHNPFLWTAESVLYEAMAKAAFAGFTNEEMSKAIGCSAHS